MRIVADSGMDGTRMDQVEVGVLVGHLGHVRVPNLESRKGINI
jgi:hypothetical protein